MSRTKYQYIFVNGRSIWDNGIARGVIQAYERYIPHGKKIPFILNIQIKPELIDVNVHPRKEEVRFLNPYRVYSAVEQAVKKSIDKLASYKNTDYTKRSRNINFSKGGSVRDSLNFSKAILEKSDQSLFSQDVKSIEKGDLEKQEEKDIKSFHQIFNKYIIVEFEDTVWIIDQHAAAERITFEKLSKSVEIKNTDTQNLLVSESIKMDDAGIEFVKENIDLFKNLGFDIEIKSKEIVVNSVPVEFVNSDIKKLIQEVVEIDSEEIKDDLDRLKKDIVATMACHTSIRAGQELDVSLMKNLYYNLLDCDNPYSCPHGRPIVWKMSIEEIDSKFDRTY
jgi:DNA mismatch repair protein MutL